MRQRNVGGGMILIFLGVFFLLRQLGWIDVSLGRFINDNWPILLILFGVHLLLSRSALWFVSVLLFAAVFLMLIGVITSPFPQSHLTVQTPFAYEVPENTQQVLIQHQAPAASFNLHRGHTSAVEGTVLHNNHPVQTAQQTSGDQFTVSLFEAERSRGATFLQQTTTSRWDVTVPAQIPLSTHVDVKAGSIDLDFSGLNPQQTHITMAAGRVRIVFDNSMTTSHVVLNTNVVTAHISVPDHVGLRVTAAGDVFANNLKHLNLQPDGDALVSANYDSATQRLHVETKTNVGALNITQYGPSGQTERVRLLETAWTVGR